MKYLKMIAIFMLLLIGNSGNAQIKKILRDNTANSSNAGIIKIPAPETDKSIQVQLLNGYVKKRMKLPFTTEEKDYYLKQQPIKDAPGYYNYVLDGDIIVGNNLPNTLSHIASDDKYKWKADIPVFFHQTVRDSSMCENVNDAIREIQSKTKVRFITYSNQADYIQIRIGDPGGFVGGVSPLGKRGGMQEVVISRRMGSGLIVHEILHSLGVYHEQSRPDRNDYVTILNDNVEDNAKHNFSVVPGISSAAYDYASIMHYFYNAFGKKDKTTITCKNNGVEIPCPSNMGQQIRLTANDAAGLNAFYSNIHFSKSKTENLIPAAGTFSKSGAIYWDDDVLALPAGTGLQEALPMKLTIPAEAIFVVNFCTGTDEVYRYSTTVKEYYPDVVFREINNQTDAAGKFVSFTINNIPVPAEKALLEILPNFQWKPGTALSKQAHTKNDMLFVWVEHNTGSYEYYLKARWFDKGAIPPNIKQDKIKVKDIKSDGPISTDRIEMRKINAPVKKNTNLIKN